MRDLINVVESQLNELSIPDSRFDAENILLKAGYKHLGKGIHGSVFEKPGASYVLKLFTNDDTAYVAFLSLVQANHNPCFPKIFGKIIKLNANYSAVRMEKLAPIDSKYDAILKHIQHYMYYRDYKGSVVLNTMGEEIITRRNEIIKEGVAKAIKFIGAYEGLLSACNLIIDLKNSNPTFYYDLHPANFMKRDYKLVFTDPLLILKGSL